MIAFVVMEHRKHYFRDYLDHVIDYIQTNFKIKSTIITYNQGSKHIAFTGTIDTIIFVQTVNWNVFNSRKKGNMFLLNTEQMTHPQYSKVVFDDIIKSKLPVIDYSVENIRIIKEKYPQTKCIHLPFPMTIIPDKKSNDVAVLGNSNYRKTVMGTLNTSYIDFNGKWGEDRDEIVKSSKILLNIHYDKTYNIFETIRCYHALEYGTLVISEPSIYMDDILLKDSIIFVKDGETITDTVRNIVENYDETYDKYFNQDKIEKVHTLLKDVYTKSIREITTFTNKKNYLYIHICTIGNWKEVLTGIYQKVLHSGLIEHLSGIKLSICGTEKDAVLAILNHPKVEIVIQKDQSNEFERQCLKKIHEHSTQEDCNICYIHTKGVTKSGNQRVKDWVNLMLYFIVERFELCINGLKKHDTVGTMMNVVPHMYMKTCTLKDTSLSQHYSGNFWWARSTYLRTLSADIKNGYIDPELWIASGKKMSMLSLWQTGVDHYNDLYPRNIYENKQQYFVYERT